VLLPFLDTDQTWSGPLVCDPSLQAALVHLGSDEALRIARDYLRTGELIDVQVPADVTRITLRALSPAQRDAAEIAAGPAELFGERIDGLRASHWLERLQHHSKALASAQGRDAAEIGSAAESAATDDALVWLDGLSGAKRKAWQRFEARRRRLMVERLALGLVDVSGWDPPTGESKGPAWWRKCINSLPDGVRRSFVNEAASHLERVGALRGVGKPHSGPLCGLAGPTSQAAGGTASNALPTTNSGSAEDGAGAR